MFISKPVIGRVSGQVSVQFTRRMEAADGTYAFATKLITGVGYAVTLTPQWQWDGERQAQLQLGGVLIPLLAPSAPLLVLSALVMGAFTPGMPTLVLGRLNEVATAGDQHGAWGLATTAFAVAQAVSAYGMSWIFAQTRGYAALFATGAARDAFVALAESQGWIAQTTSVPGVAQRTGATIYYIEVLRPRPGRHPVLSLMPTPGSIRKAILASFAVSVASLINSCSGVLENP